MKSLMEDARQQLSRNLLYEFDYESFLSIYITLKEIYFEDDFKRAEIEEIFNSFCNLIRQHFSNKEKQEAIHMPNFYYSVGK